MRYLILLIYLLNLRGCNSASNSKTVIKEAGLVENNKDCDRNYDTLLLKYASEFTPSTIALNESLSPDLKSFLLSVETNCLRKQKEYKYFIALILGKLALHHLKCCNQHYDLYQMREGAATVIINEFEKLAGYEGKRLEMLNSAHITDYIKSDKILSANPDVANVMDTIKSESKRIERGIF
jgi:hypothetical protein